jgi:hypothetical protein
MILGSKSKGVMLKADIVISSFSSKRQLIRPALQQEIISLSRIQLEVGFEKNQMRVSRVFRGRRSMPIGMISKTCIQKKIPKLVKTD